MKIKLNLKEMFTLSRIIEIQEIIGYRAALTKLFNEMLNSEDFAEIVDLNEKMKINTDEINKTKEEERRSMIQKLQPYRGKIELIPQEIQEELNQFNNVLFTEINEKNKDIIDKIEKITRESTTEKEFEFNKLTISAIKNIVESKKQISEIGLDPAIIKILIDIYIKLDSEKEN